MPRKSIPPIRVGESRTHGTHSVFRLFSEFNLFFLQVRQAAFHFLSLEKQQRNSVARKARGLAHAARSHRNVAVGFTVNFLLQLRRQFAEISSLKSDY